MALKCNPPREFCPKPCPKMAKIEGRPQLFGPPKLPKTRVLPKEDWPTKSWVPKPPNSIIVRRKKKGPKQISDPRYTCTQIIDEGNPQIPSKMLEK